MSLDRDISLLSRVPLFGELSTEQLRLLAFSALRVELKAGEILFREGAPATSGFVVSFGGVELSTGNGKPKTMCEAGSLISEMALFIETRRRATATAAAASELLKIDRTLIRRMLDEYPHVALRFRAKLADRFVATVAELSNVREILGDVSERAASR